MIPAAVSPPTHSTQAARLLDHLATGKTINPLEAWVTLGIYRLDDAVFQLRERGYPIKTRIKHVQNSFGEPCRVAEYHLSREAVGQLVIAAASLLAARELR